MNEEILKLVMKAKPPKEVLNEVWFHNFCMKFADIMITETENAIWSEYDGQE